MICPKCRHLLPDDSRFCLFCGGPVKKASGQEQVAPPLNAEAAPSKAKATPAKKAPGKPITIILAVALLLSVFANAALLYSSFAQEEKIDEFNRNIAAKAEEIVELKREILSKDGKIESLQAECNDYKALCNFLKNETPGYESSIFYASDGLIVLNQGATKETALTAHYGGYATVSMDTSGNSATIFFNQDS